MKHISTASAIAVGRNAVQHISAANEMQAAMMTPVTETVTLETSAAEPSKVMTVTVERNQ